MTSSALLEEARQLSVPERLELVNDLWDTILPEEEKVELSDEMKTLLDERLARHREHPEECSSWEEVRARILAR